MPEALLSKTPDGFIPLSDEDSEAMRRVKIGEVIRVRWTKPRNLRFFRKWWALVNFAFDHWETGELVDPKLKGIFPEKNMERFRKDLTILAGHYDSFYRIDGTVRIEAKSISFAQMKEGDFDKFYSATIDAILKYILTNYQREDLEQVVEQLLAGFG
ncbi:DUF1367 family protein [Candidatus Vondammii sp. HM_W22]|uniref:DUF1367 family protein n=1 Tax=Candidatus Vondammii sp. HM_W22 TaxID=2687299 RepID=UPI002E7BF5FE|nr:DUF1367 family protein [Candidatus Vondammii sp. HM_W22]